MSGVRQLGAPRPVVVQTRPGRRPLSVAGRAVEGVRESWLVEDRWWTEQPLRRRYWELVTSRGRDVIVFHDLVRGGWFTQR